jgi:kynureninase
LSAAFTASFSVLLPNFTGITSAPAPLYVSFSDVYEVVRTIKEIMLERDYKKFENQRELVA